MYTYELAGNTVTVLSHEAMATIYELHIIHSDRTYMAQAALDAFTVLDQIENDLSRFRANSDISRINNLAPGESLVVSPLTYTCLKTAVEYYHLTAKKFNIGIGQLIEHLKKDMNVVTTDPGKINLLEELELNDREFTVQWKNETGDLDLGGIGKGYAIDELSKILSDWDLNQVLIQGGQSSVLAMETPDSLDGWPVSVSFPTPPHDHITSLNLKELAVSSSGLKKGNHIINPGTRSVANKMDATWVITPSAIVSDILSTTFMIMTIEEIEKFCRLIPEISYICIKQHKIYRSGV